MREREGGRREVKRENDKWAGRKINEWTVVGYVLYGDKKKEIRWMCECKCGRIKMQKADNIKSGKSKMCKECSGRLRRKENIDTFKGEREEEK